MEKQKVLIISYSYPPSNAPAAQRPYALAKYIDKEKYDVTVITCANADSSLGFNEGFDEALEKVKLIRIKSLVGKGASNLRAGKMGGKKSFKNRMKGFLFELLSSMVIPDKAIFWYPKVRAYLKNNQELINGTDIVFTTSPAFSNHLTGAFLKKNNRDITWVSEIRDFHSLEKDHESPRIKQFINRKLEQKVIVQADKVTFISYSMRDLYAEHYAKFKDKFRVIYNGFDAADFEHLNIADTRNEKLTVFYAGSFYKGVRSPVPLLKIFDKLIERQLISVEEIEIRIAGNLESEVLEEISSYRSFPAVNLIGLIPRKKVLEELVAADLLWLIVGNKPTHYTGVPIKFFEYLAARRPIVNFAPAASEPTSIIAKYGLGWNFDTLVFDLDRSVDIFCEIIDKHRAGILSHSLEDRYYAEFDREHQGEMFDKIFSGSDI